MGSYYESITGKKKKKNNTTSSTMFETITGKKKENTLTSKKEEKDTSGYFKSSEAFDDNDKDTSFWEKVGDTAKTIGGTVADAATHFTKGVTGIVEGATDLVTYGAAGVASLVGADDTSKKWKQSAQNSWNDDLYAGLLEKTDKYSVLGDKSDSIAEGVGYYGGMVALSSVIPWQVTAGVTSFSSGLTEAFNEGADTKNAVASALVSAAAEVGSEYLFSGLGALKGTGDLGDAAIKKMTKGIKNNFVKNLAQYGLKSAGEGVEEIASGWISEVGKRLTYLKDEEKNVLQNAWEGTKDYATQQLAQDFWAGTLVSAISGGSNLTHSMTTGRSVMNNLTANEQKVLDTEVENRFKQELDSKKDQNLTDKQKNQLKTAIEERTLADLQKGKISAKNIQDTLGENGVNTKKKLGQDADNYLIKSYNNEYQRTQQFQYEATNDEVANNIYEKMKAKGFDNTIQSHEIAELGIKVAKELNLNIDFTTTEEIANDRIEKKQQELGRELTTEEINAIKKSASKVNGYKKGDNTLVLNHDSSKAGSFIIGHEVKHFLEKDINSNKTLNEALIKYAEFKGIYKTEYERIADIYKKYNKNFTKEQIEQELMADFTGEFFTDEAFVSNLVTTNPTFLQKMANFFKELYYKATNNQEKLLLQKINNTIQAAYSKTASNRTNIEVDRSYTVYEKPQNKADTETKVEDNVNLPTIQETSQEQEIKPEIQENLPVEEKKVEKLEKKIEKSTKKIDETIEKLNKIEEILIEQAHENSMKLAEKFKSNLPTTEDTQYSLSDVETKTRENMMKRADNDKIEYISTDILKNMYTRGRGNRPSITDQVRENGITEPLEITIDDYGEPILEDGNHRLEAAIELGMNKLPVKIREANADYTKMVYKNLSELTTDYFNKNDIQYSLGSVDEQLYDKYSEKVDNGYNVVNEYKQKYNEITNTEEYKNLISRIVKEHIYPGSEAYENEIANNPIWQKSESIKKALDYWQEQLNKDKAMLNEIAERLDAEEEANKPQRTPEEIVKEAEEHFGITNNFKETAYIDLNGNQIDFSGKHEGGPSGTRTLDHRQINEIDTDMDSFINMGNIRILPEGGGINLAIEPNKAQYSKLYDYIDSVNGEIYIDIDKPNGTYDSAEYKVGTPTRKIINDIKYYFENGTFPKQSEFAQFRFSLSRQGEGTTNRLLPTLDYSKLSDTKVKENLPLVEENLPVTETTNIEEKTKQFEEDFNTRYNKQVLLMETKKKAYVDEYNNLKQDMVDVLNEIDNKIKNKQSEYDAKKNKDTKVAQHILQQIESLKSRRSNMELMYSNRIDKINSKIENYDAKIEAQKVIRSEVIAEYRALAQEQLGDIFQIKDKSKGIKYQINTMKRNLRDIMPKKQAAEMYNTYFKPISENNAKAERFITSYNERIQKYNINNEESTYIQMIGEKKYNPESTLTDVEIENFYNKNRNKIDQSKCERAVDEFRNIYDELIKQINEVYIRNGYKPIDYRKGYFPHFIEEKATSPIGKLAEKLGWKVKQGKLPTSITGITDLFRPGRVWTSFSQQRTGDATDYNALKGLDNYLRGAADTIFHTEDIQKLRALENEIRYQFSDDGVKEKIDNIYADEMLDMEEKNDAIHNLTNTMRDAEGLGNFATEIRNYTDNLANKKAFGDRSMEQAFGRDTYSIMQNINGRVSANMVAANVSSALTNFIPLTQGWSQTSTKNMMRGIYEEIKNAIKDDGFANRSTFLINRTQQAERLYQTGLDKINNKLSIPFEAVDKFTSGALVRAKYYDNIEAGMSETKAMDNANEFAKDVMAGRSKGDMPTIFNQKNPLVKLLTAFQLEVNNQYGYMFKDVPTDMGDEAKEKLVGAFIKMFLGAYIYNYFAEKITGRKSAFSPIDMAIDDIKTMTNENLDFGEKISAIAEDTVQELPFVGGIMGGGRLPIQSAIPYENPLEMVTETLSDASKIFDEDENTKKTAINNLVKEWSKPVYYLGLPFAGGQIKKTIEGLSMYDENLPIAGSYTSSGKLRFEADTSALGKLQAAVFGQYASKNAREYFDNGYTALTEKQVNAAMDAGLGINEYREYQTGIKKAKKQAKADDESQTEAVYDYIYNLPLATEQKNSLLNSNLGNSDTVKDKNGYIKYVNSINKTYWYDEENNTLYNRNYHEVDISKLDELTQYSNEKDISSYGEFSSLEEFTYANNNPERYSVISQITDFASYNEYKSYIEDISDEYSEKMAAATTSKQKEAISNKKKAAIRKYINSLGLNKYQKMMLEKMAGGYSIKNYRSSLQPYINSLDLSKEEKQMIDSVLFD